MLKNIYAPMAGALAQERVLELIANNLANMNTVGFKGDNVTFKLLEPEPEKNYPTPLPPANFKVSLEDIMPLRGNEMAYVGVADVHRDTSQGPAMQTHDPLNVMIEGEGLFTVSTREGMRYTRAGDFVLSPEGVLVTKQGDPVLGEKGALMLKGSSFEINRRGEVYQNGELVDKLVLVKVKEQGALERVGNNYFFFGGDASEMETIRDPQMMQGYLEGSNVNPIKCLTNMIVAHRSYEAYQKNMSQFDQMMDRSSNSIGEVRG